MLTFKYRAYGLNISSDIECPELIPADEVPDVHVRFGRVPDHLENAVVQDMLCQVSPDQFLLKPENVARFLVTHGSEVVIERADGAADGDVRVYLLGSVFGALLHQRGFLPLHASAIETPRGAVAFAGPVGFGKSTLAAAFHRRGYRVLADDVSAISLNGDGIPVVTPAYPQLNLWPDAVEKVCGALENSRRTRTLTEKYGLPVGRQFSASCMPLYAVYELGKSAAPEVRLAELKGLRKIALVKDNTFRLSYLRGLARTESYMRLAAATAHHIRASRIVRPEGVFMLDELVALVECDLRRPFST